MLLARTRARSRPTRRSTRRCRARRRGRRRRSRGRARSCQSAERVLAARHRDEHPLARLDHVVVLDRPPDLLAAVAEEAVGAEARVVAAARR